MQNQPQLRQGKITQQAYALIRSEVPFLPQDSLLHPHLERILKMVRSGAFEACFSDLKV
jgi:histidine ammonia-lyase